MSTDLRIDLHTHSVFSDGTESPAELVRAAATAGLDIVGLCDHDTMGGIPEAAREAVAVGIELVPGIEVSCRLRGMSIHLLALWADPDDRGIAQALERTRTARVDRAREMVARLGRDYPLDWDVVAARAERADTVGRPHIADALVDAGVVETRDLAFADMLGRDSPYYVPHYAPKVADAVVWVRESGAVPVLAHPGAEARGRVLTDSDIGALAEVGLVGLEVDHRDHTPEQRERLAGLAARLGLIRTGSSDYHGTGKLNRLGENLTSPEAYANLIAARG